MSKQYDNTNSGALFKNDKAGNESRPDYRGSLNVEGYDYWISAWLKTSKDGKKYMSLSVQPVQKGPERKADTPAAQEPDDEIPFAFAIMVPTLSILASAAYAQEMLQMWGI